jgi:hypothetical protein
VLDVSKITLDDLNEEIDRTVDKLERLLKLHDAVSSQNQRRVEKLISEYNTMLRKQSKDAGMIEIARR